MTTMATSIHRKVEWVQENAPAVYEAVRYLPGEAFYRNLESYYDRHAPKTAKQTSVRRALGAAYHTD